MYTASDLRKGLKIEIEGSPWIITDFDFMKPGKGQAIYRCKLKNMITGYTMDRSWRSNDRFDKPDLQDKEVMYIYDDGNKLVFSDNTTYEEIYVERKVLGMQADFLTENAECTILFYNDIPIQVDIPIFVEKEITQTEPAVKGDTATNVTKSAFLDNGVEIQVPLFVNEGDVVKIDTRTGEYSERVKKK